MTNYIHKLQAANAAKDRQIRALEIGLRDLKGYLSSPKFHDDRTVQTADVLYRLYEIEAAGVAAHYEEPEPCPDCGVQPVSYGRFHDSTTVTRHAAHCPRGLDR